MEGVEEDDDGKSSFRLSAELLTILARLRRRSRLPRKWDHRK